MHVFFLMQLCKIGKNNARTKNKMYHVWTKLLQLIDIIHLLDNNNNCAISIHCVKLEGLFWVEVLYKGAQQPSKVS